MSDVSRQARDALAKVMVDTSRPLDMATAQAALVDLQGLRAVDAYDEAVIQEAGETILRLIESLRTQT
jgi:hypothetical protein